jgi:hypothetical protein
MNNSNAPNYKLDQLSPTVNAAAVGNKQGRNGNMRNSIEATKLEPIDEQQKGRLASPNGDHKDVNIDNK